MKVVLSGATGFIGGAVLQRLIKLSEVTKIVVLSRRELAVHDAKLSVVIVKDFKNYDDSTRSQISDAQACIWCLGTPKSGLDVHLDLPLAAAKAFQETSLPNLANGKQFHFVLTSGMAVVRDQEASVWLMSGLRKGRGRCETAMVEVEKQNSAAWKTFVVRPAFVSNGEPMLGLLMKGYYIPVEELAASMVDLAVNGAGEQTIDTAELRKKGRAALSLK